jgi:cyclopropane fatty-acyl-phospholipid synthase-like methyltransferase
MPDESARDAINRWYDTKMFTPRARVSDFVNYGYWEPGTLTHEAACENLMERLLAFVIRKDGSILDVACGKGATTRYLLKYYPAESVTGINISEKQLEKCRLNAPNCNFIQMSKQRFILIPEKYSSKKVSAFLSLVVIWCSLMYWPTDGRRN